MTGWIDGKVDVNGLQIQYHRTGGNKPALVLSHGTTDSSLSWTHIARVLQVDYDVIMYDRHGHGLSDAPESGYDFSDHAADLAGLIKALDLKKPGLMGHSGGAATAALVAADYPALISTLILEDPPWGSGWGSWDQLGTGLAKYFQNIKSQTRDALVADCRESNPVWTEEMVSIWAEGKVLVSPNVIQEFQQAEPNLCDMISRITCPTLLITSDPEMHPLITEADVQEIMSLFRDGRSVSIAQTGHMIHNDQPEAFLKAVKSFLDEVRERT